MFIILPFLSFVLIFLLILLPYYPKSVEFRASFLFAAIVWGVILTLMTEILSTLNAISYNSLLLSWLTINCCLICVVFVISRKTGLKIHYQKINLPKLDYVVLSMVVVVMLVEGFIAITSPPNTWDSMTYHMSRVVHWIQNNSVTFYATHISRQNHQTPWAEFAIMHLQILNEGDLLANLVQWCSMVGSVLGVSLLAEELGGNSRIQILTSVVCVTIPMGILQSSSTQNDYVLSFWFLCFVFWLIRMKKTSSCICKTGRKEAGLTGAALGLALLTKATAYIYALPFLIWYIVVEIYKRQWGIVLKRVCIIGVIAVSINLPFYSRNLHLYDHPLGPGQEGSKQHSYTNEILSLPIIISNVIRNLGLHLNTPFQPFNSFIEKEIYTLLGQEAYNPRSTWGGTSFHIPKLVFHEDVSGNPVHLILILLSLIIMLVSKNLREHTNILIYSFLLVVSFFVFCSYLRWQPWHSRLHLPLFVLFSPVVGIVSFHVVKFRKSGIVLAFFLFLTAIPWLLSNQSRPLTGPSSILKIKRLPQYFMNHPNIFIPYIQAVEIIREMTISDIGFFSGVDDWEYPFWVLLQETSNKHFHIEHVNVSNTSQKLMDPQFEPEIIVSTQNLPKKINVQDSVYLKTWSNGPVSLFVE